MLPLAGEDDFNALASTVLDGNVDERVYRLAPPMRSHGVVAPYTGAEILFDAGMTRSALSRRYHDGEQIVAGPTDGTPPAGHDVLFLVRADGQLAAVTESVRPPSQAGDTVVSVGPAPAG